MDLFFYINLLGDYGFSLTFTHSSIYIKVNQCNVKKILEKTVEIDSNRTTACLNFGSLLWNMELTVINMGHRKHYSKSSYFKKQRRPPKELMIIFIQQNNIKKYEELVIWQIK
jgi:hypothetical protein